MTYQEAIVEAQNTAHLKTEQECSDNAIALLRVDDSRLYSSEAKRIYARHYDHDLKVLMDEGNIKEDLVKETCERCDGKGSGYFSCCTGEIVDNDINLCPDCFEHLGESTCEDCNGEGEV